MRKIFTGIIILCATVLSATEFPDFNLRGGIPNFLAKIAAGKPVTVVYFGGSITEARKGWRVISGDFIKRQFPGAKIKEVNAAIGGSSSLFGLMRIKRDVLKYKPDLVFCEFAVNDRNFSSGMSKHAAEAIVRTIRKAYPTCDICFVYTATAPDLEAMAAGKDPGIYAAKEEVAKYYHLPSIFIFKDALALYKNGKLALKAPSTKLHDGNGAEFGIARPVRITAAGKLAFSQDGTHPYEEGHRLYYNVFRRCFEKLHNEAAGKSLTDYQLPKPLDPNNYADWKMLPPDAPGIKLTGKYEVVDKNLPQFRAYKELVPKLIKLPPGSGFTVEFEGSGFLLIHLRGPDCGFVEYTVDGGKPVRDLCFIPVSTIYHLKTKVILDDAKPCKHKITFKVLDKKLDKRKHLFPHYRPAFDRDPARFKGANAYIGLIGINGNLSK